MAYQAGIQNEPSVLVQNISSNIQRIQLLSNTHTYEFLIISCNKIAPYVSLSLLLNSLRAAERSVPAGD